MKGQEPSVTGETVGKGVGCDNIPSGQDGIDQDQRCTSRRRAWLGQSCTATGFSSSPPRLRLRASIAASRTNFGKIGVREAFFFLWAFPERLMPTNNINGTDFDRGTFDWTPESAC
jgi:hypothetical protein